MNAQTKQLIAMLNKHSFKLITDYNEEISTYDQWVEVNGTRVIFDRWGFCDELGELDQAGVTETFEFLTQ